VGATGVIPETGLSVLSRPLICWLLELGGVEGDIDGVSSEFRCQAF
jgi:hypothetical protein